MTRNRRPRLAAIVGTAPILVATMVFGAPVVATERIEDYGARLKRR